MNLHSIKTFLNTKQTAMADSQQKNSMSEQLIEQIECKETPKEASSTPSVWSSLLSCRLWNLFFYGLLLALMSMLTSIVTPVIGCKFFEEHHDGNGSIDGNSKYSFWNGISGSIGGLLGFLFEGYVGRLSDAFGRKKLMIFIWILFVLPNLLLLITSFNIWVYLAVSPISCLSGAVGGMPTILQAAISDIIKYPQHLTIIYAVGFGFAGLFIIIAAVLCNIIVNLYGIKAVFYINLLGMIFALLWLIFMVKETLPKHKRKSLKTWSNNNEENEEESTTFSTNNPFKVFLKLKSNKVLLWICMLALITSFPENGITDFLTNYVDDILNTDGDDKKATFINSICEIVFAITLLLSQLLITPILFKLFKSDILLIFLGILFELFMMIAGIILYFYKNIICCMIIWIMFGLTYLLIPVTNGALAARSSEKEQGVSIGVLHAIKSLTSAIAPFIFGLLYDLYNFTGDKYQYLKLLPWIVGFGLVLISFVILFGPLTKVLNEYDVRKSKGGDDNDIMIKDPNEVVINN